jgi:hypothetical protein
VAVQTASWQVTRSTGRALAGPGFRGVACRPESHPAAEGLVPQTMTRNTCPFSSPT